VTIPDSEIEKLIDQHFDQNVQDLAAEGIHALSPWIQDVARAQVRLYWKKLRDIASRVTDTEVKLQLPSLKSPSGRTFAIEGIVDIVREDERVVMYDIKTHDAQIVRENLPTYEAQLNVYAHIWQELRGERLDETAVICTQLPTSLEQAYKSADDEALKNELSKWEPVIPVDFKQERVRETIAAFGGVVDRIEAHEFAPHSVEHLRASLPGSRTRFATYVCRNCDARYSCRSYQTYAKFSQARREGSLRQYLDDYGDDNAREDFTIAALEIEPPLQYTD
jgi:hypothetical protein